MNAPHWTTVDAIKELRLRSWARTNYVPPPRRKHTWHPVVLDEMARRDAEIKASYENISGLSFSDLPEADEWPQWPAASQPAQAIAYDVVVPAAVAGPIGVPSIRQTTSAAVAQPPIVPSRGERSRSYVPLMPTGIRVHHAGHAHQADPKILRHLAESERPSRIAR